MTKPTYEEALTFIEAQGIKLCDCQKALLQTMIENENFYFRPCTNSGRQFYYENIKLLYQLLIKGE